MEDWDFIDEMPEADTRAPPDHESATTTGGTKSTEACRHCDGDRTKVACHKRPSPSSTLAKPTKKRMITVKTNHNSIHQIAATARREHPTIPFWEAEDDFSYSTAEKKTWDRARHAACADMAYIPPT